MIWGGADVIIIEIKCTVSEVEQFYEDQQELIELTPKKKKMSFSL